MPTVMPEGAAVRKAVQWISKIRRESTDRPLHILIEEACVRFNLSPKDEEFMERFFSGSQDKK